MFDYLTQKGTIHVIALQGLVLFSPRKHVSTGREPVVEEFDARRVVKVAQSKALTEPHSLVDVVQTEEVSKGFEEGKQNDALVVSKQFLNHFDSVHVYVKTLQSVTHGFVEVPHQRLCACLRYFSSHFIQLGNGSLFVKYVLFGRVFENEVHIALLNAFCIVGPLKVLVVYF